MLKYRLQKTGSRIYMLFKQDPLLHVLIFLFAGLICFFPESPSVTCTGLILMCGPAVLLQAYVLRRRRFRTISTVAGLIASAAMYTLSITADNTGVSAVLLNLSALALYRPFTIRNLRCDGQCRFRRLRKIPAIYKERCRGDSHLHLARCHSSFYVPYFTFRHILRHRQG